VFRLEPERTPWDVNFAIAGFPVRIHPFFWLAAVIFGAALIRDPLGLACWIGVFLVSITIHEMGHALAFRRFGIPCHIVLYGMGGLCIPFRESYRMVSRSEFPWNSIFISFAGPLAGFILAGLVTGVVYGIGVARGVAAPISFHLDPYQLVDFELSRDLVGPGGENLGGIYGVMTIQLLLYINIFWGLINLLPVYPLDGGRIARSLFQVYSRGEPIRQSLFASLIAAAVVIAWALFAGHQFLAIMFAFLAFNNYQELRVTGGEEYYG
jgi:membrane-associated protease RseP (regulator of RpoE activity)